MVETFEASEFWRKTISDNFFADVYSLETTSAEIFFWRSSLGGSYVSAPYRDRLAIRGFSLELGPDDLEKLALWSDGRPLIVKDIGSSLPGIPETSERWQFHSGFTNSDVRLDSLDTIRRNMSKAARKNIRRATEEYNLEIRINETLSVNRFYCLYLATRQRLGVPGYARSFIEYLFAQSPEQVLRITCWDDDRLVGGLLIYLHGKEMISAHLAYSFSERHKRVTDLLFFEAFKWGWEHGFATYRFGADDNYQAGLIDFKKKLGAVPRPQFDLLLGRKQSLSNAGINKVGKKILSGLPPSAFQLLCNSTRFYLR